MHLIVHRLKPVAIYVHPDFELPLDFELPPYFELPPDLSGGN
jgi:hypothetical protein